MSTQPGHWTFRRWVRESRAFTRPMPAWRFWPAVLRKWPAFDTLQREDAAITAVSRLNCVRAGWAFGVPEEARADWLKQVTRAALNAGGKAVGHQDMPA